MSAASATGVEAASAGGGVTPPASIATSPPDFGTTWSSVHLNRPIPDASAPETRHVAVIVSPILMPFAFPAAPLSSKDRCRRFDLSPSFTLP